VNSPALTAKVIDYREGPDFAPIEKLIGHEIHAPALVGPLQLYSLQPVSGGPAALGPFAAQMQPFQTVEAMYALVVVGPALPTQEREQALTAVADAHLGQLPQVLAQHRIIPPVRLVGPTRPLQRNKLAGPACRQPVRVDQVLSRVPSGPGFRTLFEHVLQHLLVQAQAQLARGRQQRQE